MILLCAATWQNITDYIQRTIFFYFFLWFTLFHPVHSLTITSFYSFLFQWMSYLKLMRIPKASSRAPRDSEYPTVYIIRNWLRMWPYSCCKHSRGGVLPSGKDLHGIHRRDGKELHEQMRNFRHNDLIWCQTIPHISCPSTLQKMGCWIFPFISSSRCTK